MILLQADNRILTKGMKYSFLSENEVSGLSALSVVSSAGFSTNDYILIGEFGDEKSEIRKISSVPNTTTLNISEATTFAHPESTKITKISYNQVRFYRTTSTTFSAGSPLGTVNIDAQSFFTNYEDSTNGSGYGWFIFLNETTGVNGAPSNPIPYTDFDENSAKKIIDRFFSLLDENDTNRITFNDAFTWLNEAYTKIYNELNLVNKEYTVPSSYSFSIVSGTAEYDLPSNFSSMLSLSDEDGNDIPYVAMKDVIYNNEQGETGYYLRNKYLGISPSPTSAATYYMYYNAKPAPLTSYYDNVDLPNNNYFILTDWMLYRASEKMKQRDDQKKSDFLTSLQEMKINSIKQNANGDSWGRGAGTNV